MDENPILTPDPEELPEDRLSEEPPLITDKDREVMEKRAKALKGCRKKRGFPPKSGTKCSKDQCLQALKDADGFERRAAKRLGVTFSTWTNYKKLWPELNELALEFDGLRTERVMQTGYIEAVKNKNDRMIRFWLDRKGKDLGFAKEYKEDKAPQITVNVGNQIAIQLTDDVKAKLVDEIKRKRMDELDRDRMDYGLKELEKKENTPILLEQKKEEEKGSV